MSLLFDFVYVLTQNFVLIIFSIIALVFAKKGKKSKKWFISGIVIQGIAVFGSVSGMIRNPELWLNYYNVISMIAYFVLIAAFAGLLYKAGKR